MMLCDTCTKPNGCLGLVGCVLCEDYECNAYDKNTRSCNIYGCGECILGDGD